MAKKPFQQGRSERKPDVYFPNIEDWNGWDDEVAAGCSKRFSSAAAASAEATRTFSVREASKRSENKAGSRFQHPA